MNQKVIAIKCTSGDELNLEEKVNKRIEMETGYKVVQISTSFFPTIEKGVVIYPTTLVTLLMEELPNT